MSTTREAVLDVVNVSDDGFLMELGFVAPDGGRFIVRASTLTLVGLQLRAKLGQHAGHNRIDAAQEVVLPEPALRG